MSTAARGAIPVGALSSLRRGAKRVLHALGIDVSRYPPPKQPPAYPQDFTDAEIAVCSAVAPYTMNAPIAVSVTCSAVEHVVKHRIPGAIVECGVWRGGSMMAVARTLLRLGDTGRDLFLFDTFEGMTAPTDKDVSFWGIRPQEFAERSRRAGERWLYGSLEEVRSNLYAVGYPRARLHFVKGRVEDTIPADAPEQVAFFRLDTCFYESTRHELVHLFPRLSSGGLFTIDDYGVWKGARQATDEYIEQNRLRLFLSRIDAHGARIAVKP
jgi:O-methyltransferase